MQDAVSHFESALFGEGDLLSRLRFAEQRAQRRLAFCIGSAVTASAVPGVGGAVEIMRASVEGSDGDAAALAATLEGRDGGDAYQAAAGLLLARRGQEALNGLIRRMTLHAYVPAREALAAGTLGDDDLDDDYCLAAERDLDGWQVPASVSALARLLVHRSAFIAGPVLTTNFDPLVEIAVQREGGYVAIESLDADGRINSLEVPGGVRVVHLHGYWRHSDTLHVPVQLKRERHVLQASLEDLLRERTVLVTGYGGWDDVFTTALADAVGRGRHGQLDVLWSFYEQAPREIVGRYERLLRRIGDVPGRISLYAGIDCNRMLPDLAESLGAHASDAGVAVEGAEHEAASLLDEVALLEPAEALDRLHAEIAEAGRLYAVGSLAPEVIAMVETAPKLPRETILAFDRGKESSLTLASLGATRQAQLQARGVSVLRLRRRFRTRRYHIELSDHAAYVTVPHPRHATLKTLRYRAGTLQYDMVVRSVNQVLAESNVEPAA